VALAPQRILTAVALLVLAAGVLTVGLVTSYDGPAAAPAAQRHSCPDNPAQLAGRHFTVASGLPALTCADLRGAVFDGLDLSQVSLSGAQAAGASFRHTDLIQAVLDGADLTGAHFDGADLTQAHLSGVRARHASFRGAGMAQTTLTDADLRDTDLFNASLIQSDLSGTDLRGAAMWLTWSTQATTWNTRVGAAQPGLLQVWYGAAALMLVLGVRRLIRAIRRRPVPVGRPGALRFLVDPRGRFGTGPGVGALLLRVTVSALTAAAIAAVVSLTLFNLAGLMVAGPLRQFAYFECVLVLVLVAAQLTAVPNTGRTGGGVPATR
jgi:hypothetical protein